MLREVGKKHSKSLEDFLQKHAADMPRVMLRYATERLPDSKRKRYMNMKARAEGNAKGNAKATAALKDEEQHEEDGGEEEKGKGDERDSNEGEREGRQLRGRKRCVKKEVHKVEEADEEPSAKSRRMTRSSTRAM